MFRQKDLQINVLGFFLFVFFTTYCQLKFRSQTQGGAPVRVLDWTVCVLCFLIDRQSAAAVADIL